MKREIISTTNLENETPKYRTWFSLYDIIFISVIHPESSKRKSAFRRKSKPNSDQNKKDNEMCQWHSDWQFMKIESKYGIEITGERTYEKTVIHKNEYHRIDSVVDQIAIEFQHTLGVSINEMESRYIAHSELKYTPYLVLDFTKFSSDATIKKIHHLNYKDFHVYNYQYKSNAIILAFLKEIKKWLPSKYYNNNNLFLDFSNEIIRLTPKCLFKYYAYEEKYFIENLKELDVILFSENQKEKEKIRVKEEEFERRLEYEKKQDKENAIRKNKDAIDSSDEYKFYRKCLEIKHIKNAIDKTFKKDIEYVSYSVNTIRGGKYLQKWQIYKIYEEYNSEPKIEIQYITVGFFEGDKYTFVKNTIEVLRPLRHEIGLRRITFEQKQKEKIKIISLKTEIVKGILHSIDDFALINYDENENALEAEYYLFNQKVSKEVRTELGSYFRFGFEMEKLSKESLKMKSLIERNAPVNLMNYIIQNDLPFDKIIEYYHEIYEPVPFYEKDNLYDPWY